ncbi:glycine betaine ABC transporter substrate-binding protein [Simkania sp.]|uniref:glycine betaine ABC transporter substrate-binding protein n=1 Tax=Simkania sp. TaxID=34094 RepID=UPI003B52B8E3
MSAIKRRLILTLLVMLVILAVMFSTVTRSHLKRQERIILGAKDTTGQIISEVLALVLRDRTNLMFEVKPAYDGTFICLNALNSNEIDLYIEYTGTALSSILHKDYWELPEGKTLEFLNEEFSRRFALEWMPPVGFEAAYVILARPDFAEKHGLKTLSDLKALLGKDPKVKVAFDPEFYARPEEKVLEEGYGMQFKALSLLDHPLIYLSLVNGAVDIIDGYATDGFILEHGLVTLEDDQNLFPPYQAAAVVRQDILKKHPEIRSIFDEISGRITLEKMVEMNYEVENKGKSVYHVAQQFLKREGLLSHSQKVP